MNDVQLKLAVGLRLTELKRKHSTIQDRLRQNAEQFERVLRSYWDEPLRLLELQIETAAEAGRDINLCNCDDAPRPDGYVFQVLMTLHARACQVSREIIFLLRYGYADGALARWRTLHEIIVVATIINEYGDDIARKYQLHYVVQSLKSMRQFRGLMKQLGDEPTANEGFDDLESFYQKVVRDEGSSFKRDYGWASSVVTDSRNITMADLEKLADKNYRRYYYKMACDSVHVNALGDYKRSMHIGPETTLLVDGPRLSGLADPGQLTATSLAEVTRLLLETRLNCDREVTVRAVQILADEINIAFQAAHQNLEALEDAAMA